MSTITPQRMMLGCLLAHPSWFGTIADAFVERDFADAVDKLTWSAFAAQHEQGNEATPLDVLAALGEVQGGDAAISQLISLRRLCADETPIAFQRRVDGVVKSATQVKTKRGLQKLLTAVDEQPDLDWVATVEQFGQGLRGLDRRRTHFTPLTFDRFVETASNSRRKIVIPSGFAGIDERIGGFVVTHTTAICARTNAGKSSFLAALARNQFVAFAAQHPERLHELTPGADPYSTRREAAHARHPKSAKVGEQAPYVLILSVEDDVDDYLGRFVCDLCDVTGSDYLLDPEHAVYGAGKGEQFKALARTFTEGGRLTIADYENEDGDDEKTIAQIEKTILGWKREREQPYLDRGEVPPPLLVLLDYFQKIELPEDEGNGNTPEVVLLKKASSRLHKLAKRNNFALVMAVMLLRAPDDVEPDHNAARGGSDVIQDAEVVLTLWPFGPGERVPLEALKQELKPRDNVLPIRPVAVDNDTFEAAAAASAEVDEPSENEFDDILDVDTPVEMLDVPTVRRAINELLVAGHKGRHVQAGWTVPLEFDRAHKRITNAYDPDKIYRRDASIISLLKTHRKSQGERKR